MLAVFWARDYYNIIVSINYYYYYDIIIIISIISMITFNWSGHNSHAPYPLTAMPYLLNMRIRMRLMEVNRAVCLDCPEFQVPWFHARYCQQLQKKGPLLLQGSGTLGVSQEKRPYRAMYRGFRCMSLLLYLQQCIVSLSSDKCTYCKSLWIKASKCPKCKSRSRWGLEPSPPFLSKAVGFSSMLLSRQTRSKW